MRSCLNGLQKASNSGWFSLGTYKWIRSKLFLMKSSIVFVFCLLFPSHKTLKKLPFCGNKLQGYLLGDVDC